MRVLTALFLLGHGLAHVAGATTMRRSALEGGLWAGLAMGWAMVAVGFWTRASWWLLLLQIVVLLSLAMCVYRWPEAKFGVLANVLALAAGFAALAYPGKDGMAMRSPQVEQLWNGEAEAVRLQMHGEIKLGRWFPFHAEQVLTGNNEFVWAATVSVWGLPIVGSDEYVGGKGRMRWHLLGWIPVAVADGPDVSRSAQGRMQAEQEMWLRAKAESIMRQVQFARWGNPEGKEFREEVFGAEFLETRQFGRYTIPSRIRAGWYFGTPRFAAEGEFFRATVEKAEWK